MGSRKRKNSPTKRRKKSRGTEQEDNQLETEKRTYKNQEKTDQGTEQKLPPNVVEDLKQQCLHKTLSVSLERMCQKDVEKYQAKQGILISMTDIRSAGSEDIKETDAKELLDEFGGIATLREHASCSNPLTIIGSSLDEPKEESSSNYHVGKDVVFGDLCLEKGSRKEDEQDGTKKESKNGTLCSPSSDDDNDDDYDSMLKLDDDESRYCANCLRFHSKNDDKFQACCAES